MRQVIYNGKTYKSITELAQELGIGRVTLRYWIESGKCLEKCYAAYISESRGERGASKPVLYYGKEYKSISMLARELNISQKYLSEQLRSGISAEEAVARIKTQAGKEKERMDEPTKETINKKHSSKFYSAVLGKAGIPTKGQNVKELYEKYAKDLTLNQQEVLELRYINNMTWRKMAAYLGVSKNSPLNTHDRAINKIISNWEKDKPQNTAKVVETAPVALEKDVVNSNTENRKEEAQINKGEICPYFPTNALFDSGIKTISEDEAMNCYNEIVSCLTEQEREILEARYKYGQAIIEIAKRLNETFPETQSRVSIIQIKLRREFDKRAQKAISPTVQKTEDNHLDETSCKQACRYLHKAVDGMIERLKGWEAVKAFELLNKIDELEQQIQQIEEASKK